MDMRKRRQEMVTLGAMKAQQQELSQNIQDQETRITMLRSVLGIEKKKIKENDKTADKRGVSNAKK